MKNLDTIRNLFIQSLFIIPFVFLSNCTPKENFKNEIIIGSKKFTESVILGEITAQIVKDEKTNIIHKKQLGGTRILWDALLRGEIDIYPEYTGTIIQEILSPKNIENEKQLINILNEYKIGISKPLGFNNTYALGMMIETAQKHNINTISDLRKHPDLKLGFTNEFMDRGDGWPGLQKKYNLPQDYVRGLDHDLAYRGLHGGSIDVIDLYSTDAEIKYYNLKVLDDDFNYFTEYKSVLLYRLDLKEKFPDVLTRILRLEDSITEALMIEMNSEVKLKDKEEKVAAAEFLKNNFGLSTNVVATNFWGRFFRNTLDHLLLVAISLVAAILISIPLGIFSFRYTKVGKIILTAVGLIQTIPSLALLVFMIPFFGIGEVPAIIALFLYSLLPIVRNTHAGLTDIPSPLIESAEVLGLSTKSILRQIQLPLASRSILAGIKTSAVINVGTATLGALIGAGGYGQPILTGIRLDNISLILEGAVPAALLAVVVQIIFDQSEKIFVPKGLRIKTSED